MVLVSTLKPTNNKISQQHWKQVLLNMVSVQINSRHRSHAVQLCLSQTYKSSCRHSHPLKLKFSWIVSWSNPLHCESISQHNWRERRLKHQTSTFCSTLVFCPTSSGFCSTFEHSPSKFPTARSQRHDVRNTVWVCILNDRKAVPVPSGRVH